MFVSVLLSPLLACSLMLAPIQEKPKTDDPKKPEADRSAEPQLKKVFETCGKLKNIHVLVSRSVKDEEIGAMYPDNGREIWYESPSKFRFETFGYWGDGMRYIADGEKLIVDGLDGETPVVYRDLKPSLYESAIGLNQQGGDMTLVSFLLAGEKGMKELVKKDGFIKSVPSARDEMAVAFQSTNSGKVTIYWKVGNESLPYRIEFDNKDFFMEQHKMYPDWVAEPVDPLTREDLRWLSVGPGLQKSLFELVKRPGMTIDDQRSKKG